MMRIIRAEPAAEARPAEPAASPEVRIPTGPAAVRVRNRAAAIREHPPIPGIPWELRRLFTGAGILAGMAGIVLALRKKASGVFRRNK